MEKKIEYNGNQDDNKVKLEEENKIEFYYDFEDLPTIKLNFMCVPFNPSNIEEKKRDEIFKSYKAFLACGNEIDENSGVGKVIAKLAQEAGKLLGAEFEDFFLKFMGKYQFEISSGLLTPNQQFAEVACPYFKLAQLMLVDGYCDKKMKDGVVKFVEENEDFRKRVVLIKRYYSNGDVVDKEGTEALGELLPKENVIEGSDYVTLSKRARELYVEIFQSVLKEYGIFKTTENKLEKLFDKVKENKVKTVGGSVVFATLEELLRRSFFGGNETNKKQKTKNVEDSKKLVDSKDADQYSNKEDKNSAPN